MIWDLKWNPVKSKRFFKMRTIIRTAICPAALVLCSVNLIFLNPHLKSWKTTICIISYRSSVLSHRAGRVPVGHQRAGSSQGQVFPLSYLDSLPVQRLETLVTEQLFGRPDSHNTQQSV